MSSLFWGMGAGPHPDLSPAVGAAAAGRAEAEAERARSEVRYLVERVNRLALINMALWSLVQEKTGLTEQDLVERVRQIDLMDGVEDGKLSKQVAKCPSCGRTMSTRHHRCLYCGAEKLDHGAFDSVS